MNKSITLGNIALIFIIPGLTAACSAQSREAHRSPGTSFKLAITSDGRAMGTVVLPEQPQQYEKLAAKELVKYIERMSGVKLAILSESKIGDKTENFLCIGNTSAADRFGVKPSEEAVGYDGYAIRNVGGILIIRGFRDKGTLFGVYRLLEALGCRFYEPWEEGEVIPKMRDIALGPIHRLDRPAIKYRFTSAHASKWSFFFRKRFREWLLKIGYSDAGPVTHAQTYGFHFFMPEAKYFDEHPEWYALKFGKRIKDSGDLCVSNAKMRAEFAANVIAWFREHPNQSVAPINAHDGPANCQCDECAKLDNPKHPEDRMRRMLVFANDIADRVTKIMPDKRVGLYAYYAGAFNFPDDIAPNPAIIPCFFPDIRFAEQSRAIKKWTRKVKSTFLYYWVGKQTVELGKWLDGDFYDNFATAAKHKAEAFYPEIVGWSPSDALKLCFMAHKAWDISYNVQSAQDEYFKEFFGPAADAMKTYYLTLEDAVEKPKGGIHYGSYPPKVVDKLHKLLDEADRQVQGLDSAYASRIRRRRIALGVAADFALCRARTIRYAESRDERDRVKAIEAVESAIAFLKANAGRDVVWTTGLLGRPYRLYPYMRSILTEPPRTRCTAIGPFQYFYDSMYEGPLTLADAVSLKGVTASSHCTLVKPNSEGELVYEFLAPENAVFDSAEIIPNAHYKPEKLTAFSVELSTDAGKTWGLLTGKPTNANQPISVSSEVKGKTSFLIRYRGENQSDEHRLFVDDPKVKGTIIAAPNPVEQPRYWSGWDIELPIVSSRKTSDKAAEVPPVKFPKELTLFEIETDLSYWGSYHQGLECYRGKGVGDDSCIRMWENEGPGSSYISGIPTEAGAEYRLVLFIHVTRGKAKVVTEAAWKKYLSLSAQRVIDEGDDFERVEIEIRVPKVEIDPEKRSFTIMFIHVGDDSEFFVDDVVLHKK